MPSSARPGAPSPGVADLERGAGCVHPLGTGSVGGREPPVVEERAVDPSSCHGTGARHPGLHRRAQAWRLRRPARRAGPPPGHRAADEGTRRRPVGLRGEGGPQPVAAPAGLQHGAEGQPLLRRQVLRGHRPRRGPPHPGGGPGPQHATGRPGGRQPGPEGEGRPAALAVREEEAGIRRDRSDVAHEGDRPQLRDHGRCAAQRRDVVADAAQPGEQAVRQGVGDVVEGKRAKHPRTPLVGLPEPVRCRGVPRPRGRPDLDLILLEHPQHPHVGGVLPRPTAQQVVHPVLEHGVRVLRVVVVADGDGDHGLGLGHRLGQDSQGRGRTGEAHGDGIQHGRHLVEVGTQRVPGGSVPRGTVTQPHEQPGERPQPSRRRRQPVGKQAHRGGVARQRWQPAHHDPPRTERDTPASVST